MEGGIRDPGGSIQAIQIGQPGIVRFQVASACGPATAWHPLPQTPAMQRTGTLQASSGGGCRSHSEPKADPGVEFNETQEPACTVAEMIVKRCGLRKAWRQSHAIESRFG